jgi:hypothetical protein
MRVKAGNRRHHERHQDADDRHHDEQFQEAEAAGASSVAGGDGSPSRPTSWIARACRRRKKWGTSTMRLYQQNAGASSVALRVGFSRSMIFTG